MPDNETIKVLEHDIAEDSRVERALGELVSIPYHGIFSDRLKHDEMQKLVMDKCCALRGAVVLATIDAMKARCDKADRLEETFSRMEFADVQLGGCESAVRVYGSPAELGTLRGWLHGVEFAVRGGA